MGYRRLLEDDILLRVAFIAKMRNEIETEFEQCSLFPKICNKRW